jgi:hypothetical protein
MRRLLAILVMLSPLIAAGVSNWLYVEPPSFTIRALTPEEIKAEVVASRHQKQLAAAVKTVISVFRQNHCGTQYAPVVAQAAIAEGLSPRLVAGLIFVESSCNARAYDHRGSHGLMQVNRYTWDRTVAELENPKINLALGTHILAGYIHRYGLMEGLHHYNGLGNPSQEYAERVLAAAGIRA